MSMYINYLKYDYVKTNFLENHLAIFIKHFKYFP